ncbi:MAG: sugar kinase, partial [Myxococcales bacterium]|nr:sugar kinase [Myxococcales bacterium]
MLLTVGHLTRDRYPEGFVPGGGVWYAAHAWRALGHTPRVLTAAALPDVPAERPGDWQVVAGPMTTTF